MANQQQDEALKREPEFISLLSHWPDLTKAGRAHYVDRLIKHKHYTCRGIARCLTALGQKCDESTLRGYLDDSPPELVVADVFVPKLPPTSHNRRHAPDMDGTGSVQLPSTECKVKQAAERGKAIGDTARQSRETDRKLQEQESERILASKGLPRPSEDARGFVEGMNERVRQDLQKQQRIQREAYEDMMRRRRGPK